VSAVGFPVGNYPALITEVAGNSILPTSPTAFKLRMDTPINSYRLNAPRGSVESLKPGSKSGEMERSRASKLAN